MNPHRPLTGAQVLLALAIAGCGGGDVPPPVARPCTATPTLEAWSQLSSMAAWSPRDSAAEYAYGGRLWIMGGWEDSFAPNPRDVWSSPDGLQWTQVSAQAPWTHGDLSASAAHGGRMWLMGGWANGRLPGASASNSVWSSVDGLQWLPHGAAAWDARLGAAAASHNGRLWLSGGVTAYYDGDAASLRNDVWSSADGTHWEQISAQAPWAPRAYHQMVAHEGRLYVIGGGNYLPGYEARNDVWSSSDGVNWRRETGAAPWSPRIWFSAVSYRGYLWVLGGWSNQPYRNWGDVWYSRDGQHWASYDAGVQWRPRHEHSTVILDDALWVAGGFAEPLINDVWKLALPANWTGSCSAQALAARGNDHE